MVAKRPGNKTHIDDGDEFNLNREKFVWHRELLASKLSPQAKVIGGWFAFHGIRSNGKRDVTHSHLASEVGIPHRTTRYAVKELVEHHFLFCDVQPGNGANVYTFVTAATRQAIRDDEQADAEAAAEQAAKEQRRLDREAVEQWLHGEETWLRHELLTLAERGGAPEHLAARWRDHMMDKARREIESARSGGRQLAAHPARETLDGLDAARAAVCAESLAALPPVQNNGSR
ncbi:hypothetical protein ABQF17_17545 [Mycolicibacterium elephantis]